jgi:hypothetical protein
MAGKAFIRGQTQVLFRHLPEAIFEHDDYGLCKVTRVTMSMVEVNREALFDAVADALAKWTTPAFTSKYPDVRDAGARSLYDVGVPREVHFRPFPEIFTCRKCSRTGRFQDLIKRTPGKTGRCSCGGVLAQMRYVQAHNCGRLEEIFVPRQACPNHHGSEDLAFYDPGRVKQARWYCGKCNADIQALRQTPCKCVYNDALPAGVSADKFLKVVPTGDPSLYVPHTVAFINFPQDVEGRLKSAPDAQVLMLARSWGVLKARVQDVLRERQKLGDGEKSNEDALLEALRKIDPNHAEVKAADARRKNPRGQAEVDRVHQLLQHHGVAASGTPRRWLFENTVLLDHVDLQSINDVAQMLRRRGDELGASEIDEAQDKARQLLGISDIRIINDFPLALSAYGYTRTTRDPSRAVITPFPMDDNGKIPIFAIRSETEALWFQLDPRMLLSWLIDNGFLDGMVPSDAPSAWARLHAVVPGLRQSPHESDYGAAAAIAVRTLLHTMSHIFLRRVEWSGFSPSSVGEYLLTGSLSFILYANRYAETKIGGLTTLFEQRLKTWMWDAVQSGWECVYDPICTDDGGSCAGCTHREHNCVSFNLELSRATVYGGPTPQQSALQGMEIRRGYWSSAWQATPDA